MGGRECIIVTCAHVMHLIMNLMKHNAHGRYIKSTLYIVLYNVLNIAQCSLMSAGYMSVGGGDVLENRARLGYVP